MIFIGLLIIAIGAFCQSSSYVPINKVKEWSWESYWMIQGVFAWLVFPIFGTLLAIPSGASLFGLYASNPAATFKTIFSGMLWGVGGLTFGLSMRYLGVALGQSVALGLCSGLGTVLTPIFTRNIQDLTLPVIVGVIVMLAGITILGIAGSLKAKEVDDEQKKNSIKDFNFGKGILVAVLSGVMSACFAIGLGFGSPLNWASTPEIFKTLPAVFLVTLGGFIVNAGYCLFHNMKNHTWGDYRKGNVWGNNLIFCALAGFLWYSQFFGLSLGKGFLAQSSVLLAFSWSILMSLDVTFSNIWGIILKEWKGCSKKTIAILLSGLIILVISCFLPQLL